MENGNILQFLRSEAGRTADRVKLLLQVAQGMTFLHSCAIPHGDLKVSSGVSRTAVYPDSNMRS